MTAAIDCRKLMELAELTAREKICVRLYFLEDRSQQEIAVVLGLHASRTSQLIAAGLAKLRAYAKA